MNEVLVRIIPVILIFILGYVLQKTKLLRKEDADLFLRLLFYVSLPALIVLSITKLRLSLDLICLPIIAALIIIITFLIASFGGRLLRLQKASFGVFLTGSMIMNMVFVFSFVIAVYGEEGLARASIFDFSHGLLVFTFVYYVACRYGRNPRDSRIMIKKFVLSPPLWALMIGIILSVTNLRIPAIASNFLQIVGALTTPLIMLSLGIYFSPKIVNFVPLCSVIIVRMFFGLLLGFFFVTLFHIEGLNRSIVLISSAAPVGYNTLTFSSLEKLDTEFAASLISFSILIGMFSVPLLILALR